MRRKILAAAAAFCFLLSACAGQKIQAKELDFQFDCKVDVHCSAGDFTCSFQRTGPKIASLKVISGGAEGLSWNWNGNGFTLLYQDLVVNHENCPLPPDSFAYVLVETLDEAAKPDALTPTHDNEFSGNAGYDFTLTADPETGKILTLNVPEYGISAQFYDYAQTTVQAQLNLDAVPD
ncbi:MAG: Secreted protein [Oscillospiraceae bacterium]